MGKGVSLWEGCPYRGVSLCSSLCLRASRPPPPRKCHWMDKSITNTASRHLPSHLPPPHPRSITSVHVALLCLAASQPTDPLPSGPQERAPTPPHPTTSHPLGNSATATVLNSACLGRGVCFGEESFRGRDLRRSSEDWGRREGDTFSALSPSSTPSHSMLVLESGSSEPQITLATEGVGRRISLLSPLGFSLRKRGNCRTLSSSLPWSPLISAELLFPLPRLQTPGRETHQFLKASVCLAPGLPHSSNPPRPLADSYGDPGTPKAM